MRPRRPHRLITALCALLLVAVAIPASASAAGSGLSPSQRETLLGYARDTWASFVAMTD